MTRRRGQQIEITAGAGVRQIARFKAVRDDIAARGKRYQRAAAARHATHRDQGHSRIGGFKGNTDYTIYLDDQRGEFVAHLIEFGNGQTKPGLRSLTGVPWAVAGGTSDA